MLGPSKAERDAQFSAFVEEAQAPLMRMAYALTADPDAARDLVQESLLKTYVRWGRIRSEDALAYTRRILVNHRIDVWRQRRRESPTDTPPDLVSESRDGTINVRRDLVRLLATLPEQQRKIIVLRHYADLSEAQVADLLGISVGTVKSAASRGLATLRSQAVTPVEGGPR